MERKLRTLKVNDMFIFKGKTFILTKKNTNGEYSCWRASSHTVEKISNQVMVVKIER